MSFAASQSGGIQATDSAAPFSSIDSDGDGAIDEDELGSFMSANPPPSSSLSAAAPTT